MTECRFCYLPGSVLTPLTDQDARLSGNVITRLARDLKRSESRWFEAMHKPARARVADLLLELDRLPSDLKCQPSRQEMAQLCGITPETFTRVLSDFHKRGWLERTRKTITLVDHRSLRQSGTES